MAATGAVPTIIGKPAPIMFHMALRVLNANPATTLVVGDRLDTDIAGAQAAGLSSVLVLTGVTTVDELPHHRVRPDLVCRDLHDFLSIIQRWQASSGISAHPPTSHPTQ